MTQMLSSDGQLSAQGCSTCGGVWLDNAATAKVLAGVGDRAAVAIADHLRSPTAPSNPYRRGGTHGCPVCRQALERVVTDARRHPVAGIELDICRAHGTWFDGGELGTVAGAVVRKRERDDAEVAAFGARYGGLVTPLPNGPRGELRYMLGSIEVSVGDRHERERR
jgi:Zn-finger nucleic acid-binding protein